MGLWTKNNHSKRRFSACLISAKCLTRINSFVQSHEVGFYSRPPQVAGKDDSFSLCWKRLPKPLPLGQQGLLCLRAGLAQLSLSTCRALSVASNAGERRAGPKYPSGAFRGWVPLRWLHFASFGEIETPSRGRSRPSISS